MSTSYNLTHKTFHNLHINESSNTLELAVDIKDSNGDLVEYYPITKYLTPRDMVVIFLEGLKVCSYWMDSKDFKDALSKLEDYSL
ncbi:MAG TPA: hypothetical protein VMW50_03445 [Dehalococcoidia bacterium]|nr:hypothetical protein [Dehalococcoidia bacterium]